MYYTERKPKTKKGGGGARNKATQNPFHHSGVHADTPINITYAVNCTVVHVRLLNVTNQTFSTSLKFLWSLKVALNPLKTVQQSFECKIMSSLEGLCICTMQDMAIVMKFGLKT